jgi:hypothetical protein
MPIDKERARTPKAVYGDIQNKIASSNNSILNPIVNSVD